MEANVNKNLKVKHTLKGNPTRDYVGLRKTLARNLEARYMRNLLNFTDKLKAPSCNEQQCPMMRQRLDKHIHQHHASNSRVQHTSVLHSNSPVIRMQDQAVSVSSSLSKLRIPTSITPKPIDVHEAQTDLTSSNLSSLVVVSKHNISNRQFDNLLPRYSYLEISTKKDDASLSICETRSVLPDKSFYKEHLKEIAANWLKNVPMYQTTTDKEIQENIINNLVEKIYALAIDASSYDYEDKAKYEIDICLKMLPIWSLSGEQDEMKFKNGLRNNLWLKIKELNNKYLVDENYIEVGNTNKKKISENTSNKFGNKNDSYKEICIDKNETIFGEQIFQKEIIDWLTVNVNDEDINTFKITELILKRLIPLMKKRIYDPKYKLMLKGEIFEILEILLMNNIQNHNKALYLNRCAEELANRIIRVQIQIENEDRNNQTESNSLINRIEKVSDCLGAFKITKLVDIEEEVSSTIIEGVDSIHNDNNKNKNSDDIIETSGFIGKNTRDLAKSSIKKESIQNLDKNTTATSYHIMTPKLSGVLSVYTSKQYSFAATSTPKKRIEKDIPNLNAEETAYMNKVADLIRTWMDRLPKQFNEDKNYKQTIIYDLAGDILDEVKLKQISPEIKSDSDKYLKYIVFRWLCRFDFFEDLKDAKTVVNDFLQRVKKLPIPKLTRPHHGNRQTMKNIQHIHGEMGAEDFVPQGIDILEDQISVWMNEQPSGIYVKKDKASRNNLVHGLALTLQDRLRNKSPESEIDQDINQWLKNVVKPKEQEHIGVLTENLKQKVINIPQDETLEGKLQKMKRERAEYFEARSQKQPRNSDIVYLQEDPDKTIKDFIVKFVEHNYDIDDPMARGAFSHLLKIELRKLNPLTRKEVYDNFSKSDPHELFSVMKLSKELEYIKMISDWLKNIPINHSYNTVGNRQRVDFVNDLAKNIAEAEEQREQDPTQMDFDLFISSIISQSMRTYNLPILAEHKKNEKFMVDQLMNKIVANRLNINSLCNSADDSSIKEDTTDIKEQGLSEFIDDYIRLNGRDIANDEVKLEAWSARLLKEIKKMVHENDDPNTLCKAQVYNRFIDVPIPGDESVRIFGLELQYVKEISEWIKNLPLLPIVNDLEAQNKRIEAISELAEKMAERTIQKTADPKNTGIDENMAQYVTNWISKLPLDSRQDIVLPLAIRQLMNRIDRVNKKDEPVNPTTPKISNETKNKNKISKSPKERKPTCCNTSKCQKNPGKVIVEAIEDFANKLPIQGDIKTAKAIKDTITKNLYQKIAELNVDPRIFNDDFLYQEMLEDEIDTQLENVPQNIELQNAREKLKMTLMDTILDAKKSAKANAAGENYKHKLETTIDASFPNPLHTKQETDPGFEIYKSHLANMFILENFDHENNDIKVKYEKQIRNVIDKYYRNALMKNALPLKKDQIYNELYSALFKVPIPCGKAVADDVEEIKTLCEIETWFEELPVKEATGTHELLERYKILTALAKRIYQIEKEPKHDEKIRKEITKWLEKLPFIYGQERNISMYAYKLQDILKSTASIRKCVVTDPKTQDYRKNKRMLGTSQTAGPSSAGRNWVSPPSSPEPKPCCISLPRQKPSDIVIEIVEDWCNQIPLTLCSEENKIIHNKLFTNIIIKISELNTNPEAFDNSFMWLDLLGEELDKLFSDLPISPDIQNSMPARKYQLIEMLKSIQPIMKEENDTYKYKEDLNNTVKSILKEPHDSKDKSSAFNDLMNDIVESFVEYNYNRHDEEIRQVYKQQVLDAVVKYFTSVKDHNTKEQDPLMVRNQLLCELAKIPVPSIGALKDIVDEIRMKTEVEKFFTTLPSTKGDALKQSLRKQAKTTLSKQLNDIEKTGHNCPNDRKMKSAIYKCLKKIELQTTPEVIDAFIEKLKSNEGSRKIPPSPEIIDLFTTADEIGQSNYENFRSGVTMNSSMIPQIWGGNRHQVADQINESSALIRNHSNVSPFVANGPISQQGFQQTMQSSNPLIASPSQNTTNVRSHFRMTSGHIQTRETTPKPDSQFYKTYVDTPSIDQEFSPSSKIDRSLGPSDVSYDDFSGQVIHKSSLREAQQLPSSDTNSTGGPQAGPCCSVAHDSNLTPSSQFNPPRFNQIDNLPKFRHYQLRNEDPEYRCEPDAYRTVPTQLHSNGGPAKTSYSSPETGGVCNCVKKILKGCKGRPECSIELNEYCDECGGFGPMWRRMCPGFIFY